MKLYLTDEFARSWVGTDPFEKVLTIDGDIYRDKEGRRTLRFEQGGQSYFLKVHQGIGWGEILKNLIQLRLPVLGAANEWHAIKALSALGIDTMEGCAYGKRGLNPAKQQSFIVTKDLINTTSLEDYCRDWASNKPDPRLKRALLVKLAEVSRTMHKNGINHRDYYLCHFLLDTSKNVTPETVKVSLIDLHRAQIRKKTPERWLIKDLAGLYFSAMDCGLTKRDVLRFIRIYSGRSVNKELLRRSVFWAAVKLRAEKLYIKDCERQPPKII